MSSTSSANTSAWSKPDSPTECRSSTTSTPAFSPPPYRASRSSILVENAVRHGIARRSDAGRITVTARRDGAVLELSVTDDGAGLVAGTAPAAGHGLDNTRERLRTLYGEGASLELIPASTHGAVARLRIPYRELALQAEESR